MSVEVVRVIVDYVRGLGGIDTTAIPRDGSRAATADINLGDNNIYNLADPTADDQADTQGARNRALEAAIEALTLLINQKMNAFGIGIVTATLSSGYGHVNASVPEGAECFPLISNYSDYEGRITAVRDATGIAVQSTNQYDNSTVKVLWIRL